jgi:hypothetical protein
MANEIKLSNCFYSPYYYVSLPVYDTVVEMYYSKLSEYFTKVAEALYHRLRYKAEAMTEERVTLTEVMMRLKAERNLPSETDRVTDIYRRSFTLADIYKTFIDLYGSMTVAYKGKVSGLINKRSIDRLLRDSIIAFIRDSVESNAA